MGSLTPNQNRTLYYWSTKINKVHQIGGGGEDGKLKNLQELATDQV